MPSQRRNYDGGIWRLTWERTSEGMYRAWVVGHPEVSTQGRDWTEVERALYDQVDQQLQAGEWTSDWSPSPPDPAKANYCADPDFVVLVPDARYYLFSDVSRVFESVCPRCGTDNGSRTAEPLTVYIEESAGIVFSGIVMSAIMPGADLFSRAAIDEIGPQRIAGADVRSVNTLRRRRSEFLEVLPDTHLDQVAIRGHPLGGWVCPQCGRTSFSMRVDQNRYISVVRADRVPRDAESFWVQESPPRLCVRWAWWNAVRRKPAFRGVISRPLYTASESEVLTSPPLPERWSSGSDLLQGMARAQSEMAYHFRVRIPSR